MKFRPVGAALFSAVVEKERHEEAVSCFALQMAVRINNHTALVRTLREQDAELVLLKVGYTLVTLPRTVTPYRDSVDGTRDHVTYQKLVTR
jgi:hypothetical protein